MIPVLSDFEDPFLYAAFDGDECVAICARSNPQAVYDFMAEEHEHEHPIRCIPTQQGLDAILKTSERRTAALDG